MQEFCNGIWPEISRGIRTHLSTEAFQRWFAAIELVGADECALTLQVPNSIYQFWIESNYLNVVQSVVVSVLGSSRQIIFRAADTGTTDATVCSELASQILGPGSLDEDSSPIIRE
jgi:chromosomal replication initiation ATPase DnaA